jgi:hypothetical protein
MIFFIFFIFTFPVFGWHGIGTIYNLKPASPPMPRAKSCRAEGCTEPMLPPIKVIS